MAVKDDVIIRIVTETKQAVANFAKLAIGIGVAITAIKSIGRVVKDMLDAYGVQEQAEAKLEAAIKATGGAAGFTARELKNYAAELQSVTTFGDEAIIEAEAMMLTFRNIGRETFPRAIEATADLAAMLNTDLKTATIQLGKALNDPILGLTALGRSGVQFTEKQKELVKGFMNVNDVASAQNLILLELEGQLGGTARAMAETATGEALQLANAFGDIKESIGGVIANSKALSGVRGYLSDVLSGISNVFSYGEELDNISAIIDAVKTIDIKGRLNANELDRMSSAWGDITKFISKYSGEMNAGVLAGMTKWREHFGAILEGQKEFETVTTAGNQLLRDRTMVLFSARDLTEEIAIANTTQLDTLKLQKAEALEMFNIYNESLKFFQKMNESADVTGGFTNPTNIQALIDAVLFFDAKYQDLKKQIDETTSGVVEFWDAAGGPEAAAAVSADSPIFNLIKGIREANTTLGQLSEGAMNEILSKIEKTTEATEDLGKQAEETSNVIVASFGIAADAIEGDFEDALKGVVTLIGTAFGPQGTAIAAAVNAGIDFAKALFSDPMVAQISESLTDALKKGIGDMDNGTVKDELIKQMEAIALEVAFTQARVQPYIDEVARRMARYVASIGTPDEDNARSRLGEMIGALEVVQHQAAGAFHDIMSQFNTDFFGPGAPSLMDPGNLLPPSIVVNNYIEGSVLTAEELSSIITQTIQQKAAGV